jgi:CHAT domain-containing protein
MIYIDNKEKKKALAEMYIMASLIHQGKDTLKKNYSNFKPSDDINHTGLLVEIPNHLLTIFKNDTSVLKQVSSFYKMALQQFKNCYRNEEFSNKLRNYYQLIMSGLLKANKYDFREITSAKILNDLENIENKLAWKEFIKNRHSSSFLSDSILNKELSIRSDIVLARKKNDTLSIVEFKKKLERHQRYLSKTYPSISKSLESNFDISHLQKNLASDELIIRYKKIDTTLHIIKITKTDIDFFHISYQADLVSKIKTYVDILKGLKENLQAGKSLMRILIPFNTNSFKKLTVVPDDILYSLPFETLVTSNNEYLLDSLEVSYASYLIFIHNDIRKSQKASDSLYVFTPNYQKQEFAQDLIGAKEESIYIDKLFNSRFFKDENASKSSFVSQAHNANLLHLAMHARIDHQKPELSYFLFSEKENDTLYLEELYALNLQADLAVLSACNTANEVLNNHKGVVSLQRAFTHAGVSSNVSSIWEAPDKATKEIMVLFYQYLKEGETKSRALQKAKQEYLRKQNEPELKAPYYWASFIVNGDISPIKSRNAHWPWYLGSFIIIIIVVFRRKLLQ